MSKVLAIAAHEFRNGLRNRWVLAAVFLFASLSLLLALLGSAPIGSVTGSALAVVVASLASLAVYLVPLIALMLSHDAIVGEAERGTLLLLLTYPVTRGQLLAGKFLGQLAILATALVFGFGLSGLIVAANGEIHSAGLFALAQLILSAILLGAAFIAIGLVISITSREQATAIGRAMGIWLTLIVLYDLALIGLILSDGSNLISPSTLTAAMAANPADAFRIFNLAHLDNFKEAAGIGASTVPVSPVILIASISLWAAAAGAISYVALRRLEP